MFKIDQIIYPYVVSSKVKCENVCEDRKIRCSGTRYVFDGEDEDYSICELMVEQLAEERAKDSRMNLHEKILRCIDFNPYFTVNKVYPVIAEPSNDFVFPEVCTFFIIDDEGDRYNINHEDLGILFEIVED